MRTILFIFSLSALYAADQPARTVDPTFLRRNVADVQAKQVDVTTDSCQYKPLFGEGDSQRSIVRGVVRFGAITVIPSGTCKMLAYPPGDREARDVQPLGGPGAAVRHGIPGPARCGASA